MVDVYTKQRVTMYVGCRIEKHSIRYIYNTMLLVASVCHGV